MWMRVLLLLALMAVPVQAVEPVPTPEPLADDTAMLRVDVDLGPWVEDSWDLNLEMGVGAVFRPRGSFDIFGRLRVGAIFIRDTWGWSLGATVDVGPDGWVAPGLQGEALHLVSKSWLQVGSSVSLSEVVTLSVGGGWSFVGVELQMRMDTVGTLGGAIYGKLRIPVRMLMFWLEP